MTERAPPLTPRINMYAYSTGDIRWQQNRHGRMNRAVRYESDERDVEP